MESSGKTCKGGKVILSFVPSQRARRRIKVRSLEECFFKAPVRYNQCHLCRTWENGSWPSKVLFVARLLANDFVSESKKAKLEAPLALSFSDEDKVGTI